MRQVFTILDVRGRLAPVNQLFAPVQNAWYGILSGSSSFWQTANRLANSYWWRLAVHLATAWLAAGFRFNQNQADFLEENEACAAAWNFGFYRKVVAFWTGIDDAAVRRPGKFSFL